MLTTAVFSFLLMFPSFWTAFALPDSRTSQELDAKLRAHVQNYSLVANSFPEALTRVASDFQIPMGIQWVTNSSARTKVNLNWEESTVQEVIEGVVNTQPGYEVQVANGIVHVYVRNLIPDQQNFLKLKIKAFDVQNVPVESAARKLRDLVKLTTSPTKPQHGTGGIAGTGATNVGDPMITVRINNVNVEDVLDGLAVASARKIWIVTFSNDPILTPTGFRRTVTLWNKFPIPDDEQPVWDHLHWGDQLPPR